MIQPTRKLIFVYAFAYAAAQMLSGCKHKTEIVERPKTYCIPDSLFPNITIDTVRRANVMGEVVLTGQITPDEEKQVSIYPLASGTAKKVFVELGDHVEAGQLLALIHSPDMAGYLSAAYNSVRDLDIAKKQLEQTQSLYKSGIASEVDYITAQKNYEKQLSVTKMNNEIVRIYGGDTTNLSDYYIKAPVSGYIVAKNITTGTQIRPDNGNGLFTIADLKEVWAVPNIFEADIPKIKMGYDANVTCLSYPDKEFKGKIDKIFNLVTPDTKVMNVRVKLQNPGNVLKPGMFARIVVPYPEGQSMLAVPSSAVIFEDNQNFILRYKGKCSVEMEPVTIFRALNGTSYISQGKLDENDMVITKQSIFIFNDIINLR